MKTPAHLEQWLQRKDDEILDYVPNEPAWQGLELRTVRPRWGWWLKFWGIIAHLIFQIACLSVSIYYGTLAHITPWIFMIGAMATMGSLAATITARFDLYEAQDDCEDDEEDAPS